MEERQKNGLEEALETGASAAHLARGTVKAGKAVSGAAKGAAMGGPYGAAAGALWEGRKFVGKVLAAAAVLLLLPVLFVLMLPGLIFDGFSSAFSPADTENPILNSETAVVENANTITFTISSILGEGMEDVMERIGRDFAASDGDEISSLTGDLLTVGMFVALDFVWDRAKEDRTEEKTIFIDECWQLLSGAGATGTRLAGDFVLEIFKTIRGYGGSAVCASQDLNDFFNLDEGRFGKGIINNSKTKIILNLEDDEAMRVQSALHLSDAEVMEVTHFERGNGLISTNNNNIMVEFKASPLEKDLITTDRRELKDIVERMRRQSEAG